MKQKLSKLEKMKIWMNVFGSVKHSHERENERRRRQIEKGMIKITASASVLFITLPSFASTNLENIAFQSSSSMAQRMPAMVDNTSKSIVSVKVELEDIGHHSESYTELMSVGSTTSDAFAKRHKITYGQICADQNGVLTVDGVGDFIHGDYWIVSINGDYLNTNAHTKLKSGDLVKWQRLKSQPS